MDGLDRPENRYGRHGLSTVGPRMGGKASEFPSKSVCLVALRVVVEGSSHLHVEGEKSGCTIPYTEERAITLQQLKAPFSCGAWDDLAWSESWTRKRQIHINILVWLRLGRSRVSKKFVPGSQGKMGLMPGAKPGFLLSYKVETQFVPGTNGGRWAAEKVNVLEVYVSLLLLGERENCSPACPL